MFRITSKRLLSINKTPSAWQKHIITEQMKIKMDLQLLNRKLNDKQVGCISCTNSNNKKIKHWSSLDFLIATSCVLFSVDIALKLAS